MYSKTIDEMFLASETEAGVVLSVQEANEVVAYLKKLERTIEVAEWFLDEKECRLTMYYELKGDKESKEWLEFQVRDTEWIKLTEEI